MKKAALEKKTAWDIPRCANEPETNRGTTDAILPRRFR
jgi:hypothetical protein